MRKILIVDDEQIMLILAKRILSPKYEIVTAKSGAEAIKIFEKEKPDLILSDLRMPEMDGYELHRILQEKIVEPVPIIFMTADESDESESKGFAVGAADYIRKPWKPDVLLRRVGNIINNLDKIRGLKAAASIDTMTGLLNKTASQKEIGELVEMFPGTLLMIDLDSFKLVNDIYGHGMGDKILIRLSELIKEIIGDNDLAGRMGGDEFIAYLTDIRDERILQEKTAFLNKQLLISAKKLMGENMEIPLGVSVGAVFSPNEGKDFSTLYKKADVALYDVKQHGKHNCSIYGLKNFEKNTFAKEEKLSQIRMILGERNIEAGAYFVDFEHFQTIYRMFVRLKNIGLKNLQLIQFCINSENHIEKFGEILLQSLRTSDCVTQNGNKFFALLPETTAEKAEKIRENIFSQIKDFSANEVDFEMETIF